VVDGKVYDTTKFNHTHPGGGSSIFINAGSDTTEEFEAIHSNKAWGQLLDWYIGDIVVRLWTTKGAFSMCPVQRILCEPQMDAVVVSAC
jgi:cytochrome b involved in lipid metabolism